MQEDRTVTFTLGDLTFEYDEEKNKKNIHDHGISFRSAARVFFDYDRIELYDEEHSEDEDRYNVIGDTSAGNMVIGSPWHREETIDDILFVVYTERTHIEVAGKYIDIIRLISLILSHHQMPARMPG